MPDYPLKSCSMIALPGIAHPKQDIRKFQFSSVSGHQRRWSRDRRKNAKA